MKGWEKKTIGELCDEGGGEVKTGPFGAQLHQSDYQDEGTPVVMPTDIIEGEIDVSRIARVSETHVERLHKHKLSKGDIVYGRRGDIGRQALVRSENVGWLCGTGCLRISFGKPQVLPEFIHLYLSLPGIAGWVENQAVGATMPNLNTGILRRVPVWYPKDLDKQRKIASIIFTYDGLIANNKRRIALLENMAEEIYREWFVRMRFPGYEIVKFKKGVPEGWTVKNFRDIVIDYIGGGWGEENQSNTYCEGAYVIRGTDIPKLSAGDLQNEVYRYHKPSNLESRMLRAGDFVFEVSGGSKDQLLGRNLLLTEKLLEYFGNRVMGASFCKQLRFDKDLVSPYVMKYFLKLYYDYDLVGIFQVQSTGISNYQFESFLSYQSIILPPPEIQVAFDKIIKPILDNKDNLALSNLNLKKTRDSLLGKLISGKLSVENLDIQFPPSMQDEATS